LTHPTTQETTHQTPCSICNGTGWKPTANDTTRVTQCDCVRQQAGQNRSHAAHIPSRHQHCIFTSFSTVLDQSEAANETLKQAYFQASQFAQNYPVDKDYGLLLMGSSGTGKTHLSVAILHSLLEKGVECLFCDFRDLLKKIQDSYNPVSQTSEMEVLTPVLEVEVLLLDDLGASKPSDWVLDTVGHILNTRYNKRLTTIITTNYSHTPNQSPDISRQPYSKVRREDTLADRIGERIVSRLYEMCRLVYLQSGDFRRMVKQV